VVETRLPVTCRDGPAQHRTSQTVWESYVRGQRWQRTYYTL
jgi:hypothetical protein